MAMKGNENIVDKMAQMLGAEEKPQDAVDLLKADHRKVEGLFKQFESARTKVSKQALIKQIIQELTVHATIEENLVYPILAGWDKSAQGALEALEEHHLLKLALFELSTMPIDAKNLSAKVTVIKELVRHHVKEEESELLPQLKKSGMDLWQLAGQIRQRKQQILRGVARHNGGQKVVVKSKVIASGKSKSAGGDKTVQVKATARRRGVAGKSTVAKKATVKSATAKSSTRRTSRKKRRAA